MKTKLSLGALAFLLIAAIFTARAQQQQPPTEPVAGSSPLINERLKCGVAISGPKWIQVNDDDDNENGVWDWEGPPLPGGAEPTDGEKRTGVITVTATLPDTCPNAVGICVTAKGTSLQRIDGFWPGKVVITDKAGNVVRQWGNDDQAREKKVVKEQPYSFSISPGESAVCHVWFEGYHHSEAGPPDVLVEAKSADGTPCGLHGHLGPQIHKLSVYQVDLDVDSNNNEGFEFAEGSPAEDQIEASERPEIPGKIIAVPINPDADGDGVEDWRDGFGVAGGTLGNTRFVPMVVHLPEPYDPEQAVVEFSYKMSDPRSLAANTPQAPVGFRIWTSDAGVPRSLNVLPATPPSSATGFFVPAGQEIQWKLLAANCAPAASGNYAGPAVIVFLETVFSWGSGTSPFQPKEKITVSAGPSYGSIHAVVVPPADPPPITTDTVHIAVACTGSLKISGPGTLVVNDNDDNKSDTWDKEDPAVPAGDPQIKVVTVEAEAGNQPLTVNILPALPGADQIIGGYFLDGTKIGRHSLPLTVPAYQKVVANLHVEGVRNSAALEDVTITASVAGSGYNSGSNLCVVTPPDVSRKLTVYQVDLDVDSNNNEGFEFAEGSPAEDQIEASDNPPNPGKIIAVPLDADVDADGVPDWKDGFGVDGGTLAPGVRFVPMIVNLPPPYDPATAVVQFAYTMSDPRAVNPGTTTPPPSGFRIWTADAMVPRTTASPGANPTGGTDCFIPAGESVSWANLAANCASAATGAYPGQAVIVYLETLVTSTSGGPAFDPRQQITVTANATYGDAPSAAEDTVQIAVRCTGKVEITGPKNLVVNDNDDNSNDKWDKFDTPISPADPDVIPITVTATAGPQAITVTVASDQCGTGLGNTIRGFFPDASKGTPLMQTQFDVPANTSVPKVFYIEGISNSAAVDDVVITATATGSVPYGASQPGGYDNKAVHKLTVYQVDLDVDSNNNEGSTFTPGSPEEDQIEASGSPANPGKLINLNHDDDNMNDIEDKAENSATVTAENDLQPINLGFSPAIAGGKIILSAPSGGSKIQLWKNAEKGAPSEKITLPATWELGSDVVPSSLYVEGIAPGSVRLRLVYEVASVEVCKDEVNLGVVKLDFKERANTSYGYDDGTVDNNPVPKSSDYPPQKYDWVNVDKDSKTTEVEVEITPAAYASFVHLVSSAPSKATCSPVVAAVSPQKLTITGMDTGNAYIRTTLGTSTGAESIRLNTACYKLASISAAFYKVSATGLAPDATTAAQLEARSNDFLKRGVCQLLLNDNGTTTVPYDDNGNSILDIDTTIAGGGSEWSKVTGALAASTSGLKLLHAKALRVNIGGTWINASGLQWGDWTLISDASMSKERTVAHEMLHQRSLGDTGPAGNNTANIMFYESSTTKYFVGRFKVEQVQTGAGTSKTPAQYEMQWEQITRN